MQVKKGDTVTVHYKGKLKDGTEFDNSYDRDPLVFETGANTVIPGFENAIIGKNKGDHITVNILPEDAYGQIDPELVFTVARAQVPSHIPLTPGTPLQLSNDDGHMDVTITDVDADDVTLDANHPLAGKELAFEIEILDIKPKK